MRRAVRSMFACMLLVLSPVGSAIAQTGPSLVDVYNHQTDHNFRKGLQMRLAWTGDYAGRFSGEIDAASLRAIRDFQARHSMEASGVIDEPLLQLLLAESDGAKKTSGFVLVDDVTTGARVGIPQALVRDRGQSTLGHLWRSDDEAIEIETVRIDGEGKTLRGLFDVLSRATADRTVATAELSGDDFRISGKDSGREYLIGFGGRDGDLRGYSISYDPKVAAAMRPVGTMAANLFEPFGADEGSDLVASGTDADAIDQVVNRAGQEGDAASVEHLVDGGRSMHASAVTGGAAKFETSGSGFVVSSDGWVVTNAHVARACQSVLVGQHGAADRVVIDDKNDLALVHVEADLGAPLAVSPDVPRLGEDVLALGYPLRSILAESLNVTRGNVSSLRGLMNDPRFLQISAPVQPGNSGGPLVDLTGRVVGVVTAKLNAVAVADATGDIPQSINFAIRPDALSQFLATNGIGFVAAGTASAAQSVADTTAKVQNAVMPVICLGSE